MLHFILTALKLLKPMGKVQYHKRSRKTISLNMYSKGGTVKSYLLRLYQFLTMLNLLQVLDPTDHTQQRTQPVHLSLHRVPGNRIYWANPNRLL